MSKISELEGLRGVLAWWVVVAHALFNCGLVGRGEITGLPAVLCEGGAAVDLFIILSGFVIALLLSREGGSYGSYLARRAWRLYPAYLACLVVALAYQAFGVRWMMLDAASGLLDPNHREYLARQISLGDAHLPEQVAAHLVLLHGAIPERLLPGAATAILPPSWSISLEWQFYLVAPIAFLLIRSGGQGRAALLVAVAACVILRPRYEDWFDPIGAFLPLHAEMFMLGALSYRCFEGALDGRLGGIPRRLPMLVLLALVMLTPFGPALSARWAYHYGVWVPFGIWGLVFGSILAEVTGQSGILSRTICRFLASRPLTWLGRVSYSTYLSHLLVLDACTALLVPSGAAIGGRWWAFAMVFPATAAGTLLASAVLYRWVEAPGIAMGRRVASKGGIRKKETPFIGDLAVRNVS